MRKKLVTRDRMYFIVSERDTYGYRLGIGPNGRYPLRSWLLDYYATQEEAETLGRHFNECYEIAVDEGYDGTDRLVRTFTSRVGQTGRRQTSWASLHSIPTTCRRSVFGFSSKV